MHILNHVSQLRPSFRSACFIALSESHKQIKVKAATSVFSSQALFVASVIFILFPCYSNLFISLSRFIIRFLDSLKYSLVLGHSGQLRQIAGLIARPLGQVRAQLFLASAQTQIKVPMLAIP